MGNRAQVTKRSHPRPIDGMRNQKIDLLVIQYLKRLFFRIIDAEAVRYIRNEGDSKDNIPFY